MPGEDPSEQETYSAWTVVNVVFGHLTEQGLHPTLGAGGNPGAAAADMLRAFGIVPSAVRDDPITHDVRDELAELRATLMDEQ